MKQALTTGGQLSVWYAAAQAALEKMGVLDLFADTDNALLKGTHPEFGDVEILFFVPQEGKTRMEIAFSDTQIYSEFKKTVVPEYKTLFMALAQSQKTVESNPAPESQSDESTAPASDETASVVPDNDEKAEEQPKETVPDADKGDVQDYAVDEPVGTPIRAVADPEIIPETKQEEPAKKGKGKKVGIIIAAVLIFLVVAGAAVYFFVFRDANNSNPTKPSDNNTTHVDPANSENQPVGLLVNNEQYQQIQNGMTYEEVCNIFSPKDAQGNIISTNYGQLLSETTTEDGAVLKIYYWNGQGESGTYASVSFQDGIAVTKTASDTLQ